MPFLDFENKTLIFFSVWFSVGFSFAFFDSLQFILEDCSDDWQEITNNTKKNGHMTKIRKRVFEVTVFFFIKMKMLFYIAHLIKASAGFSTNRNKPRWRNKILKSTIVTLIFTLNSFSLRKKHQFSQKENIHIFPISLQILADSIRFKTSQKEIRDLRSLSHIYLNIPPFTLLIIATQSFPWNVWIPKNIINVS